MHISYYFIYFSLQTLLLNRVLPKNICIYMRKKVFNHREFVLKIYHDQQVAQRDM